MKFPLTKAEVKKAILEAFKKIKVDSKTHIRIQRAKTMTPRDRNLILF